MVAGSLAKAGYFMGSSLIPARSANPKGFFEDVEVNMINESLLAPLVFEPALACTDSSPVENSVSKRNCRANTESDPAQIILFQGPAFQLYIACMAAVFEEHGVYRCIPRSRKHCFQYFKGVSRSELPPYSANDFWQGVTRLEPHVQAYSDPT